jgi:L-ascorbate metabolism protein UlaG (beta-lactamase superfamily)
MVELSGKVIYFDPYQISADEQKADIILVSHDHYDHFEEKSALKVTKDNTNLFCPGSCSKAAKKFNSKKLKPGEKATFEGINIRAVPAYNPNKRFHPKSNEWLGFIVDDGKKTIYHAGDTGFIPEMGEFMGIDYALIPVGGTYTMNFEEAIEAAKAMQPKNVIPMHNWDKNLDEFEELLKKEMPGIGVVKLKAGEIFEI